MPPKVANPRKQFQFGIILPGLDPFLCQKVKSPDLEFEVAEHGDTNFLVKTAGILKVGMVTLEKISSAVGVDKYISTWMDAIGNTNVGGGAIPSAYKRTMLIEQYSLDGQTVIETLVCSGVWPQKKSGSDFDRKGSENTIEQIEFCVDEAQYV